MTEHTATSPVVVTDNPAASRYEARLAGDGTPHRVAVATYERLDGAIVFLHTVVPTALQGHGIGAQLVRAALDDARRQGLAVIPRCPFFAAYLRAHPADQDLIPAEMLDDVLVEPPTEPTDD